MACSRRSDDARKRCQRCAGGMAGRAVSALANAVGRASPTAAGPQLKPTQGGSHSPSARTHPATRPGVQGARRIERSHAGRLQALSDKRLKLGAFNHARTRWLHLAFAVLLAFRTQPASRQPAADRMSCFDRALAVRATLSTGALALFVAAVSSHTCALAGFDLADLGWQDPCGCAGLAAAARLPPCLLIRRWRARRAGQATALQAVAYRAYEVGAVAGAEYSAAPAALSVLPFQ